jgi:hypothetical protein
MNDFTDAADLMFEDPNRSKAASYRLGGTGPEIPVAVLFSRPMREMGFGVTGLAARDLECRVRRSEIAAPKRGDTVNIDDVLYRVEMALPDAIDLWAMLTLVKA